MSEISAVILSKNEEDCIGYCLSSLTFCNEIIVVDDFSRDNTEDIAKEYGAKIYKRTLQNDFSKQRNFGLEKAKHEWVLFVDADEIVSEELACEIKEAVLKKDIAAYSLERQDTFLGKKLKYGDVGKRRFVRLGQKTKGKWRRRVHEVWDVEGKIGQLVSPLLHYPHASLFRFISSIHKYSHLHAISNKIEGKKSSIFRIVFTPATKFVYNFFVRQGFRDGVHGFVHAMMMSIHSFLAWSEMYFIQKNEE